MCVYLRLVFLASAVGWSGLLFVLVVAAKRLHHELGSRVQVLDVGTYVGTDKVESSSAHRDESINGFLSPHPSREPTAYVAVQQVYLSSEVSFDVEDSGRLVRFQHLEDVRRFETREIPGQLAGLAASVVGDLSLASQHELLHAEGFEDVIVGPGV